MDQLISPGPARDLRAPTRRRLGVVAGLGPRNTARFYAMLCDKYRALTGGASPDVVVQSISVQRHLVERLSDGSFRSEHREALGHLVTRTCRSLADGGADVIAIACNATTVDATIVTPARIGMVEGACQRLHDLGARRVGLLASSIMVWSAAYEQGLGEAGITVVTPAPRDQEIVDKFIEAVQWSRTQLPVPRDFLRVVTALGDDVDALVLDSADLCGVVDAAMAGKPVIDSVSALAEESCRALLNPWRRTGSATCDTSPRMTLRAPLVGVGSIPPVQPQADGADEDPDTRAMPAFPYASYPWAWSTSGDRACRPLGPKQRGMGALTAGFIGAMCFGAAAGILAVHYTNPPPQPAAVGQPVETTSSGQSFGPECGDRCISRLGK